MLGRRGWTLSIALGLVAIAAMVGLGRASQRSEPIDLAKSSQTTVPPSATLLTSTTTSTSVVIAAPTPTTRPARVAAPTTTTLERRYRVYPSCSWNADYWVRRTPPIGGGIYVGVGWNGFIEKQVRFDFAFIAPANGEPVRMTEMPSDLSKDIGRRGLTYRAESESMDGGQFQVTAVATDGSGSCTSPWYTVRFGD